MLAGALEIQLMADMSRLTADMQSAQQLTGTAMGNISASISQAKDTIDAMAAAEKSRASLFDRTMSETKRLLDIVKGGASDTGKALADLKINPDALKIPKEAFDSLQAWQDKAAYVFGAGAAAAATGAQKVWEEFKSTSERTLVIWGVAAATGIAAVVFTAVYAAYKSASFVIGLFTGESYKSPSIDALVKQTDDLKASQDALALTLSNSVSAIRSNGDAMDAMGVAYKDDDGKLLSTVETLQNAVDELDKYTEGSARAAAANALGLGSYEEITKALKKVDDQSAESRQRLNDYNLGIGTESAAAVAAYKAAMVDFNDESQKTSDGFKRAWADQIMPILTDFAVYLKDGFPTAVSAFRNSMALITSAFYGFKTIMFGIYDSIMGVLQAAGNGLAGLAAAAVAIAQGNFAGAKEALLSSWADAKDRFAGISTSISDRAIKDASAVKLAWATDNRVDGLPMKAITEGLSGATAQALNLANSLNSNKGALSSLQQDFIKLNAAMDDMAAHGQKGSDQYNALESALMKVGKQIGDVAAATKTATAATDPQVKAYSDLIASINQKIEANTLEATVGRKLTEAETQALEIRKLSEKGTISLTQAESDLTKAKLKQLETAELAKLLQASEAKQAQEIALTRQKLNQDGYDQAKLLQESEDALNHTRLQSGKDTLEQIQFDTQALGMNTQQREIAVAMRTLEKSGIKEGTEAWAKYGEAIRAAVTTKASLEKGISDFKTVWDSVDKTAQATFTNIFQGGQNAFTKLRDTLKSTLLDLLYQMTVKKWVFDITASVSGASGGAVSAVAQSALGGGGGLSGISSLASAGSNALGLSGFTTGISSTIGSLAGSITGLTAANTALASTIGITAAEAGAGAAAAAAAGGTATLSAGLAGGGAITAALGAIGPVGWAAIAAVAAFSIFGGKKESASASTGSMERTYDASGAITSSRSPFAVGNGADVIDSLYTRLSGLQTLLGATGGASFGYGAYSGTGNKNPQGRITGGAFNSGEIPVAELDLAASRAILSALQASDMPKGIAAIINSIDPAKASADQITQLEKNAAIYSQSIKALSAAFDNMPFANLKAMAFDAADALVAASGGLQNLSANLATYEQNFYSAEEQRAQKVKDITRTLNAAGVGVTSDEIANMSRNQYRALVESIQSVSEANAPAVAALYATSAAFVEITPAAVEAAAAVEAQTAAVETYAQAYNRLTDTTKTAEQQAQTRIGLEDQLLQLTGTADQLRAKAIAGMDAYNVAMYDSVQAATKATQEASAATAAAVALAATNKTWIDQLDVLTGKETQRSQALRDAGDDSTRAIMLQVYAQQDLAKVQTDLAKVQADATAKVNTTRTDLISAYGREQSALQSTVDKFRTFSTALKNFRDGLLLGGLSPLTPAQRYEEASRQFEAAKASGDATALQSTSTAFLDASKVYNASSAAYIKDFATVQDALTSAAINAAATADVAQLQLDAVKSQLTILGSINSGVQTLAQALAAYSSAAPGAAGSTGRAPFTDQQIADFAAPKLGNYAGNKEVYDAAYANRDRGVTLESINRAAGLKPGEAQAWAVANGLPVFHSGTDYVPQTGFALLEQGEAVIPRAQNASRPSGGQNDTAIVTELKALREEVKALRSQQNAETGALIQSNFKANEMNAKTITTSQSKAGWSTQPELA